MEIEEITRYKFDGKEYNSVVDIQKELENRIGKIIDSVEPPISLKSRIALFDLIVKNKAELIKCLNVTVNLAPNELQGDYRNALDLYKKKEKPQ